MKTLAAKSELNPHFTRWKLGLHEFKWLTQHSTFYLERGWDLNSRGSDPRVEASTLHPCRPHLVFASKVINVKGVVMKSPHIICCCSSLVFILIRPLTLSSSTWKIIQCLLVGFLQRFLLSGQFGNVFFKCCHFFWKILYLREYITSWNQFKQLRSFQQRLLIFFFDFLFFGYYFFASSRCPCCWLHHPEIGSPGVFSPHWPITGPFRIIFF